MQKDFLTLPEIVFILVRPQLPENIGAVARAINTMGFNKLVIIDSTLHKNERARWLAVGSQDILATAKSFDCLSDALIDVDFTIGTTARKRKKVDLYLDCNDVIFAIKNKVQILKNIAIVFGPEDSGLSNAELELCNIISSIPLKNTHPSLNLSQAVMIYAYELSQLSVSKFNARPTLIKPFIDLKHLLLRTEKLLDKIGIGKKNNSHKKIINRISMLNQDDLKLYNLAFSQLEKKGGYKTAL